MIPLEEVRAARPPTPPQARHRRGSPAGLLETRFVEAGAAAMAGASGGGILKNKNREIKKLNPSNRLRKEKVRFEKFS